MIGKITSQAGKVATNVLNCKASQYGAKQFRENKAGFVAGVTLSSILLKDAIGCVYYVKQSLENKKIPEEKRKFVAALDMANGGLMIIAQFAAFFTLQNEKVQEGLFGKAFGKVFSEKNQKVIGQKVEESLKKIGQNFDDKLFNKGFESARKSGGKAFGALISLVGATVVAKRMIVPYIATPLAQWVKDNIINKGVKDKEEIKCLDRQMVSSSMPAFERYVSNRK